MDNNQTESERWSIVPHMSVRTTYYISSHGRAKSIHTNGRHQYLTGSIGMRYGKPRYRKVRFGYVHRLVALHFIPNPHNKPQVNHIDGNKQNNHYTNLEWVTGEENIEHSVLIGTAKRGTKPPKPYQRIPKELHKRKLRPVIQLDKSGNEIERFDSIKKAAEVVGVRIAGICSVCRGYESSIHGTYWKYA